MAGYELAAIPFNSNLVNIPGGAVETTILQTPPVNTPGSNASVSIMGMVDIQPGTACTSVIINLYRGADKNGVYINNIETAAVAGDYVTIPFTFVDNPGDVAGELYTVTLVETAATANGFIFTATIGGFVS